MAARIRRDDEVVVISGAEKGKRGKVLRVYPERGRALVQGVNMAKRHTKQRPGNPGGIVEKEASLHISNLALVDPKTNAPTRVGFRILDDGRKVRVARKSGEMIDI